MTAIQDVLDRVRKVTDQTAQRLQQELDHIEGQKRRLTAELDEAAERIRLTLQQLRHNTNGKAVEKRGAVARASSGKRIRRTPQQLKAEAEAIIELVKSKGSQGATGNEIRERHPKIGPDLKGFVQKYSGRKLKSTGAARTMRYFA